MFPANAIGIGWGLLTLAVVLPVVAWAAHHKPTGERLLWLAAATYLVVLLSLTFLPVPLDAHPARRPRLGYPWYQLESFVTIGRALRLGPGSASFYALIGNLLAFVPVGLLVPLLRPTRFQWLAVLLVALGLSAAIEVGQLAASLVVGVPYRQADIDDVIVNTIGGVLGYAALATARWLWRGASASFAKRE